MSILSSNKRHILLHILFILLCISILIYCSIRLYQLNELSTSEHFKEEKECHLDIDTNKLVCTD